MNNMNLRRTCQSAEELFKVYVRVRPLGKEQNENNYQNLIRIIGNEIEINNPDFQNDYTVILNRNKENFCLMAFSMKKEIIEMSLKIP